MAHEAQLKPGWLGRDVLRAVERRREWSVTEESLAATRYEKPAETRAQAPNKYVEPKAPLRP